MQHKVHSTTAYLSNRRRSMARKPGSAQIVLTGHQLILQNMFTDRGIFILVYLRPSSVNEGCQADAHTHTRGVGRQRKRVLRRTRGWHFTSPHLSFRIRRKRSGQKG
ncbi:hypothetical protein CDAR_425121 [Caerostris darwini]|uniref:Uncharacterized protein n=1 Tax=Caerostris darwini TaxID=1538125 RepID=A0AAV4X9N9_9ARAC|nr:hypothetical protein CDAR_425121 [Caerostris darwini]